MFVLQFVVVHNKVTGTGVVAKQVVVWERGFGARAQTPTCVPRAVGSVNCSPML